MKIIFAERLKELMKEQGLNQVKLAEGAGVKQNTISAWLLKKRSRASQVCGYSPTILAWTLII